MILPFFFPSGWLVGLNLISADASKDTGSYFIVVFSSQCLLPSPNTYLLSYLHNCILIILKCLKFQTGKLYEAADETGMSLVYVSGCFIHSHSLDTEEKEMMKVHWCRSHWSNKFFIMKRVLLHICFLVVCLFAHVCTCLHRILRVVHQLSYWSRLTSLPIVIKTDDV